MNVLLISRPGVSLLRSLRESETAWDAIRFYGPIGLTIGVYIPVSTLAGAISLASDLRYFLRKYTTDHLFQIRPGVYCTSALTKSRYLTRDLEVSEEWQYRLVYWIENMGRVVRFKKEDWNSEEFLYNQVSGESIEISGLDEKESDIDPDLIHDMSITTDIRDIPSEELQGGYILEVWCTKPEYELI